MNDMVAYVVVMGRDETITLDADDVARLARCLRDVPLFSPTDDAEQRSLMIRMAPMLSAIASR